MITVTISERGVKVVNSKGGEEYVFSASDVFSRRRERKGVTKKRRQRAGRPCVRAHGTGKAVVEFLKNNPGAHTAQEIARHLILIGKTSRRTVKAALSSTRSVINYIRKTKKQIVSRGRN